jgi:hypothetical protein
MNNLNQISKLILICGHGIYIHSKIDKELVQEPVNWVPANSEQSRFYIKHIEKGIQLAKSEKNSLLLFSGGQTRKIDSSPKSEAESYQAIAREFGWLSGIENVGLEEYARDSMENLLFGLCKFFQVTNKYPDCIDLISFSYKAYRFDLHRKHLGLSREKFTFVGVDNPPYNMMDGVEKELKSMEKYIDDPYGLGEKLQYKKNFRNPFNRIPHYGDCPIPDWFPAPDVWKMITTR